MDGGETREKADFNMAVSYLNRLNILFSACDEASINLNIYSWFHSLLATYRELSTWMKKEERESFNNMIKKVNPSISQVYKKATATGRMEIPNEIYMSLHEMEIDLRQVAKKSGLLMKIQDDALNALQ